MMHRANEEWLGSKITSMVKLMVSLQTSRDFGESVVNGLSRRAIQHCKGNVAERMTPWMRLREQLAKGFGD